MGDLQPLKGLFGSGELLGEQGDLFTQPFDGLANQLLSGFDLFQELLHERSRSSGVLLSTRRAARARSGWKRG
ncbi:hypothetical protein ACPCTO_36490 [Streptomyces olivoreticuli]